MDKNQTIGIVLIVLLFIGYSFTREDNTQETKSTPTTSLSDTSKVDDRLNPANNVTTESVTTQQVATTPVDSSTIFEEKQFDITTLDYKLTFSNKGGRLIAVELNNYDDQNGNLVQLFNEQSAIFNLSLDSKKGPLSIFDGEFTTQNETKVLAEGEDLNVVFTKTLEGNKSITHTYSISSKGYLINYNFAVKGFANDLNSNIANIELKENLKAFEKALTVSRQKSTVNYYTTAGDFDDIGAGNENETLEEKVKWFTFNQRFFNTSVIPNKELTNVNFTAEMSDDDPAPESVYLDKSLGAKASFTVDNTNNISENIKFYYGPNDYRLMKDLAAEENIPDFDKNVYLGWKVFSYINKWLVIPLFRFLENYISSYGVIILILVIVIKMILFPIAYKSYLSMAKMKELKPEIDEIKKRLGDDKQMEVQQESMKLYQKVGASPLSGCIPMVLQMPIFFALFNFFPNFIELRHESFLWANDLSSYDDLISWQGFAIPFIGNHISLFTLLMTLSTLAYTYYNNQLNSAAQQGPMKMMGYLMPVMFFFVLNDFAAGLTWYYFIANIVTISQQKLASQFIDKDKIRAQMEENKKNYDSKEKSGKKSGFRQRLEEAQKLRAAQAKKK
ncbi:membrane protein insertase YidC [Cyclobacteriaceae bacterium]|nr:membrane protein insertase YidC [Cyclobacteriaceae bacterium]